MNLSEHFTLSELCKSDTATRLGINNITSDEEVIANLKSICNFILEPIRTHYDIAFTPNSGFRSSALNKSIGSTNKSQHCKGQAVDIELIGVDNSDLALWIEENLNYDQLILEYYQIGQPTSGWVHVSFIMPTVDNRKQSITYDGNTYQTGLII
tara:strand:- start:192 stop:653 length:462 start_codon:yes stop_codon:yes gene_type:complete